MLNVFANTRSCGVVDNIDPGVKLSQTDSPQTPVEFTRKKMYTVNVNEDLPDKIRKGRGAFADQISAKPGTSSGLVRPDKVSVVDELMLLWDI